MQNNQNNPKPETVAAVRAHVALRVDLLASCARGVATLSNAASRWAYAEGRALADGLTDRDAIQRAVCEKFPKLTGNGKPSKTPSTGFKTSYDKFVLLADVRDGTHRTYTAPALVAIAEQFFSDGNGIFEEVEVDGKPSKRLVGVRMSLNDAVDRIKDGHAAAGRAERAAETDEQKAARKASEEEAMVQQFAGTVAASPAMLNALASRIAAFTVEEDADKADALEAVRTAIGGFAELLAASEQKLAA